MSRPRFPLETESSWFVLANFLDGVLTWLLLRRPGFVESNPIARYFLHHWGVAGMNYFKLAVVFFVLLIAQVVAHYNYQSARFLLVVGTGVVAIVVAYSMLLMSRIS